MPSGRKGQRGEEASEESDGQEALLLQPRMALKTVHPCPSMLFSGFPGEETTESVACAGKIEASFALLCAP